MSNITRRPGGQSRLDTIPGLVELVAEAYASGRSYKSILEDEDIPVSDPQTLRRWVSDERVMRAVEQIVRERVLRITRKVDSALEARIMDPRKLAEMPVETLLKVRKELMPDVALSPKGESKEALMEELWKLAASDPAVAHTLNLLNQQNTEKTDLAVAVIEEED